MYLKTLSLITGVASTLAGLAAALSALASRGKALDWGVVWSALSLLMARVSQVGSRLGPGVLVWQRGCHENLGCVEQGAGLGRGVERTHPTPVTPRPVQHLCLTRTWVPRGHGPTCYTRAMSSGNAPYEPYGFIVSAGLGPRGLLGTPPATRAP